MKKISSLLFFFLLITPLNTYAATLVGYWDFNESSGNIAYDQSGFNNNGQLTGATRTVHGKVGNALDFTGQGGVTVPNSSSLDSLPGGFTLSAWIYPTYFAPGNVTTLFFKWDRANQTYPWHDTMTFQAGLGTKLYSAMNEPAVPGYDGYEGVSSDVLSLNEWNYVAWMFDENFHRLYHNGIEVFSEAYASPWTGNHDVLLIGEHPIYSFSNFLGYIDEPRIYCGALTQDEILRDMNGGAVIPEPSTLLLLVSGLLGLPFMRRKK
ncbi:MAG: LamG domain-containing protein [Candidatus Omnitrophica bacterium]|nr:LamG domain-containing protein [Candidatus Omnitrophota bacterium]MDD5670501.1 LamG domain-containing protein [Candidatus Omnitrophota bacterium]